MPADIAKNKNFTQVGEIMKIEPHLPFSNKSLKKFVLPAASVGASLGLLRGLIGKLASVKDIKNLFNLESGASKMSPSSVAQVENFTRGDKHEGIKTKHIPTTRAIKRLVQEALNRNIGWPGGKEVLKPNIKKAYLNKILSKTANYFIAADIPTSLESELKHRRNPDSLHITLSYLGDKTNEEILKVKDFLRKKSKYDWKDFTIDSPNYSRMGQNKIPIRRVSNEYRLKKIVHDLRENPVTSPIDIYRPYMPHITVGKNKDIPKLFSPKNLDIPIHSIGIYKIKGPDQYDLIKDFDLKERNLFDKIIDWFR